MPRIEIDDETQRLIEAEAERTGATTEQVLADAVRAYAARLRRSEND